MSYARSCGRFTPLGNRKPSISIKLVVTHHQKFGSLYFGVRVISLLSFRAHSQ